MPAGIDYGNAASYLAFATVKAGAYTAFAWRLNRHLGTTQSALRVGGARTAIGMAVGGAYFAAAFVLLDRAPIEALGLPLYWTTLVPLRVLEWLLLLRLFYWPSLSSRRLKLLALFWALCVSYLADVPAAIGWLVTGGLWIC